MKWYFDLYTGPSIGNKQNKIIKKLNNNKIVGNVFLIVLPANSKNLLEIIPAWCAIHYENLSVVGLAQGKREARELVAMMIDEVFQATGAFDVTGYLKEKQKANKGSMEV